MKQSGIYMIRNKLNGKFYIGSSINIRKRWSEHTSALENNKHFNKHLQSSWKKHGKEMFEFIIIKQTKSNKNILIKTEQYFLDYYKSYDDKIGYNISKTSIGPSGIIRNDVICRNKENGKLISQYRLSGKLIKTWKSIMEASVYLKIPHSTISRCCRGFKKNNTCKNFIWRYGNKKFLIKDEIEKICPRTILQYRKNGTFIKEWANAKTIKEELNIKCALITSVCLNRTKSTAGFVWVYKNNNIIKKKIKPIINKSQNIKILQYNMNGILIKEWNSMSQIRKNLNMHYNTIRKLCSGNFIFNKKYIFKYKRDEI